MSGVITYPDKRLLEKSVDVSAFDDETAALTATMKNILLENNAMGLAAPQIGVHLRVIAIGGKDGSVPLVLVNPEVAEQSGYQFGMEGCLSIPGSWPKIERAQSVTVNAHDINGEPFIREEHGETARAILHEIDHLDGILMWDRLPEEERDAVIKDYMENAER
ncbi:MAG: peptide deformylase [Nitrospinota bacterium]